MQTAICIALGKPAETLFPFPSKRLAFHSRAGRFGTKGLAITFVSSDSDQQVMAAIQSRFEVAVPELPDHIDPASYSTYPATFPPNMIADVYLSDLLITVFFCCFFLPCI